MDKILNCKIMENPTAQVLKPTNWKAIKKLPHLNPPSPRKTAKK
jgi:hypothetical protein